MRALVVVVASKWTVRSQCGNLKGLGNTPRLNLLVHTEILGDLIACLLLASGDNCHLDLRMMSQTICRLYQKMKALRHDV